MRAAKPTPRRGVTLVEMLVVVALVVLMMVILVSIFGAATGAISTSRTYQELDNNLRMLDQTIRSDLAGVTAKLTPPLDPKDKLGYFEYGENSFADLQGEDTDDYIAFTAKAPEGHFFSGRIWIPFPGGISQAEQINQAAKMPVVITSQFAEIIYFLRNGNLYRRVLLVTPERRASISTPPAGSINYPGQLFGYNRTNAAPFSALPVSWQGMHDISCRPTSAPAVNAVLPPIPNDLGDLTDRHNRGFRPRFMNDYYNMVVGNYGTDGSADDNNNDDIPDYYPTLYPNLFTAGLGTLYNENLNLTPYPSGTERVIPNSVYDLLAFPYINPAMYSRPDVSPVVTANGNIANNSALGWIHSPDPSGSTLNHNPIESGDSLAVSTARSIPQTWFGFPTWRDTMAGIRGNLEGWTDPIRKVNTNPNYVQPWGLRPFPPNATPAANSLNFPPPLQAPYSLSTPFGTDGAGSLNFDGDANVRTTLPIIWEDDLIMTGVRSFDIKAYDPDATLYSRPGDSVVYTAGYHDLGYASAVDASGASYLAAGYPSSQMATNNRDYGGAVIPVRPFFPLQDFAFNPIGFGHEGRIPPLINDNRVNPARPYLNNFLSNGREPTNLGDDSSEVIRLRRVFDTWSTTYSNAPSIDLNNTGSPLRVKAAAGDPPPDLPVYPSYPAPYPSPLRGIQIQIRVVDPRNERVKILTIRQDFSDKL